MSINILKISAAALALVFLMGAGFMLIPKKLKNRLFCGQSLRGGCEKSYNRFLKNPECFKNPFKPLDQAEKLKGLISLCLKENRPKLSLKLYEFLLKSAEKESLALEILFFEESLAELSFSVLKNYEKALKYYVSLLGKALPLDKEAFVRLRVAESFFLLNKPSQALREIGALQKLALSAKQKRQVLFLKARVFSIVEDEARGKEALVFLKKMIEKYPQQADYFREYLAMIHESNKNFLSAIEELEKMKSSHSWARDKIRRLKERQQSQPGFDF